MAGLRSPTIVVQAIRLVKNSIIAIESPEAEVDDVDFVDDLEEIHDVVERFRRNEQRPPAEAPAQASDRQQGKAPLVHVHLCAAKNNQPFNKAAHCSMGLSFLYTYRHIFRVELDPPPPPMYQRAGAYFRKRDEINLILGRGF